MRLFSLPSREKADTAMKILIKNPIIVNDGESFRGSVIINNGKITHIFRNGKITKGQYDQIIEADDLYLIPGVIDDHVHFREPGLTEKATIYSESRAAAAGGVTSFMDMPNTKPQTTTVEAWKEKLAIAAEESLINYSFYFGATNSNCRRLSKLNPHRVCGIKLFMGASTGNMLVDEERELEEIFRTVSIPLAVHCEDSNIIARNTKKVIAEAGDNPDIAYHPVIRNSTACYNSTKRAVELARKYGTRLHILHISTKRELSLLSNAAIGYKKITSEVTPAHLTFCSDDYKHLGAKIKCNPAIKSADDREALRKALSKGLIDLVGTDHAPHLLKEKEGGALTATSGLPSIQFSLLAMLELVDKGVLTMESLVEKMCHAPAKIFEISKRGFIKRGYFADLVLLRPNSPHTIEQKDIISKCGWSPFEGTTFNWTVAQTWVNGECAYNEGTINNGVKGKMLTFDR